MSSLIPPRQLAFSTELAATIGLEEAILLQCLSEASQMNSAESQGEFNWHQLDSHRLLQWLPFWSEEQIARIAENLRQQGIILLASPPLQECKHVRFAFNEPAVRQHEQAPSVVRSAEQKRPVHVARPMATNWHPDETCAKLLAQQGVPENYMRDQIPEFVQYWTERGEARHSWGNRFVSHVLRQWREYETRMNRKRTEEVREASTSAWSGKSVASSDIKSVDRQWQPSLDALEILQINIGIPLDFIESVTPEFVLYWSEKGVQADDWNSRFIRHVKTRWAYHTHEIENDTAPKPITRGWRPNADTIEHLQRYSNISAELIEAARTEFVIYWLERNEPRPSWNKIFLDYVKTRSTSATGDQSTRDRSIAEDLTDRSWAS